MFADIDGVWTTWENTERCSVTCGVGVLLMERNCNDQDGIGANCTGDNAKLSGEACTKADCSKFCCHYNYFFMFGEPIRRKKILVIIIVSDLCMHVGMYVCPSPKEIFFSS